MTFIGLIAFLGLLLGFGFLIFVHELGHFLVAKWVGIKCTQFAIGFGHSILTYRKGLGFRVGSTEAEYERRIYEHLKQQGRIPETPAHPDDTESESDSRGTDQSDTAHPHALHAQASPRVIDEAVAELGLGETEYRLNYIPLGGYVKMLGQEDMDPAARSADPRSFNSKSISARAAVISAGVVMNVIVGVLFFVVAFMSGVEFPPAIVGGVEANMPAAAAYAQGHEDDPDYRGLRVGDRITHINDRPTADWTQLRVATALGSPGAPVDLVVERRGYDEPLRYRLTPEPGQEQLLSIGVMPPMDVELGLVAPNSAPARAGVEAGWRVVAVDGEPVDSYGQFHHAVMADPGRPVEVTFAEPEVDHDDADWVPQRVTVALQAEPRFERTPGEPEHLAGLVPAARITFVAPDSPAERGGVQAGDAIARLEGVAWPRTDGVASLIGAAGGGAVSMTVLRNGEQVTLDPMRPQRTIMAQLLGGGGRLGIGLSPAHEPIVSQTLANTPAAALELPPGSRIVELNGEPVASWADVQRILAALEAPDEGEALAVPIAYELNIAGRPSEEGELTLGHEHVDRLQQTQWLIPRALGFQILQQPVQADNPWQATVLGVEKTGEFMVITYRTLLRLIQGTIHMQHLRGPVGIVDEGTQIAQHRGWQYLMFFLGLISVNLAVINFLPIPIVDGGHMVFLLVEKLKGSPVSGQVQAAATYVGLALIAFVFITVLFYDVSRLLGG